MNGLILRGLHNVNKIKIRKYVKYYYKHCYLFINNLLSFVLH